MGSSGFEREASLSTEFKHSESMNTTKRKRSSVGDGRTAETSINLDGPGIFDPDAKSPISLDDETQPAAILINFEEENSDGDDIVMIGANQRVDSPGVRKSTLRDTSDQTQVDLPVAFHPTADEVVIRPGDAVELTDSTFLKVQSLRRNSDGVLRMRGFPLMRDDQGAERLVDSRPDELIWMVMIDRAEHLTGLESQTVDRNVADVKQLREVVFTNYPWDRSHQRAQTRSVSARRWSSHSELPRGPRSRLPRLYCRWKYLKVMTKKGNQDLEDESCFRLLQADEIENMVQFKPSELRRLFRDGRSPAHGGSDVSESFDAKSGKTTYTRQYTTGDAFCGAGGLSKGAVDAGFRVRWGFDSHEPAISTYRANFGPFGTRGLHLNDQQFTELIKQKPGTYEVDHVHFSPPCQPFSAANTTGTAEKNWENSRPVFSLCEILKTLRPRVATIEETVGMLQRHPDWFYTVIANITRVGYSLRWRKVDATQYGVPQCRLRLLVNIAAPGEKVPRFAEPTHGVAAAAKPFNKISIIKDIPLWASLQNTMTQARQPKNLPPHDWDAFAHTLTTNGGQNNHHPDGNRHYTVREMACLQRFPHSYEFFGGLTDMKRMIGNAVPPALARTWLREVVRSLRETDIDERSRERSL